MAKIKDEQDGKTIKQCPNCGATVFQGPYGRGEIVNGEFVTKETLYNCANCHRALAIREMVDRPIVVQ